MISSDCADIPAAVSFRDPAGRLFRLGGRMLRAVNPAGVADVKSFLASPQAEQLMAPELCAPAACGIRAEA
jgi:hypothetical protein